jgi:hypothetical protein
MVTLVVYEPQLLDPTTVYFFAGQLTTRAVPVISHECPLKLNPSGSPWPSATKSSHRVTSAKSPALFVTSCENAVVARVRVCTDGSNANTGHTAITRIVVVKVVLPPLLVAVMVYDTGVVSSADGTPLISPVLVSIDRPAGRVALTLKVRVAPPSMDAALMDAFLVTWWPRVKVMLEAPPL